MKRFELTHVTIWPTSAKALVALQHNGKTIGQFGLTEPLLGSVLAKSVPDGLDIQLENCIAVYMRGEMIIATSIPFDTVVKTERARPSLEDRLERLENLERRKVRLLEQQARRAEQEEVIETPPSPEPEPAPVVEPDPSPAPEPKGAG